MIPGGGRSQNESSGVMYGERRVRLFSPGRETLLGVGRHLGKDLNLENKSIPGGARGKRPRPRE